MRSEEEFSLRNMYMRGTLCFMLQMRHRDPDEGAGWEDTCRGKGLADS